MTIRVFSTVAVLLFGTAPFGPCANAEDFRAECYQHYGNVLRGEPAGQENDYNWTSEVGFNSAEKPAYLILIDLPSRELEWIDIVPVKSRTSRFYNGEESPWSVSEADAEVDVMGPQLTLTTTGAWGGEWTFELLTNKRAILRHLSATNTFQGVMIEIAHAECTLSGTHSILLRDQSSSPPAGFENKFWDDAETAFREYSPPSTEELQSSPPNQ